MDRLALRRGCGPRRSRVMLLRPHTGTPGRAPAGMDLTICLMGQRLELAVDRAGRYPNGGRESGHGCQDWRAVGRGRPPLARGVQRQRKGDADD